MVEAKHDLIIPRTHDEDSRLVWHSHACRFILLRMQKPPSTASERSATPRAAIYEALLGKALSALEISARTSVREKDVASHLEHLARSLRSRGERLVVTPAECLGCGFVFRDRQRFTCPSRCPKCADEHVAAPAFRVERPTPG